MLSANARLAVNANISGIVANVGQAVYDSVDEGCAMIKDRAQEIVPVDTGALRESIDYQVYRGIQNIERGGSIGGSAFSVTGIVQPDEPYAAYVEFGTGIRGASSPGAGAGPYSSTWPGMPAQPYMRPALDESRDSILDLFRANISVAI